MFGKCCGKFMKGLRNDWIGLYDLWGVGGRGCIVFWGSWWWVVVFLKGDGVILWVCWMVYGIDYCYLIEFCGVCCGFLCLFVLSWVDLWICNVGVWIYVCYVGSVDVENLVVDGD